MKLSDVRFAAVALLALLGGCVNPPIGPQVAVMPAPNKPFEVFAQDQEVCKQYATQQIGGPGATETAAANQGIATAVVGTVLGAGLGAAVGGAGGAAIGAASGAIVGTAVGAGTAQATGWEGQRRYDLAYAQCMYAKGNQIPGAPVASMPPPPPPNAPPPANALPPVSAAPAAPVTATPLPPAPKT